MPRSYATLCVGAALASAFLLAAGPAAAAVSGTLALTNDYLFRGLSQTNQEPALQGGVEYAHDSGVYAGVWGSNVSWLSDYSSASLPISSSVELDGYVGWRGNVSDALKLDAGVYTYYYPGDYPTGFVRPYTTEVYLGASWGPASLKYYHAVTNLFGFAESDGSGYLDASVNYEFSPGWVFNAHAGRQRVKGTSIASYTDWKLGLTRNFDGGWSLAAAYADTNAERSVYTNAFGNFLGRSTGTLTITKAF
ncbi:TorF family putative porin [Tahibacter caeni]|uniref:TorF family putative porin n=1 Tax=Tahibacter caeni TaxID=1453545 RepID=UPI0021496CC5|nr:TorF family putative porin [Tahibacter caeni]